MKVKPLKNNIQIKFLKLSEQSNGIITNLDQKDAILEIADVIECGDDVKKVSKGDKVVVKQWAVDTIATSYSQDDNITLVSEDKVLAIVE